MVTIEDKRQGNARRQAEFRERKRLQNLQEVRGIFLIEDLHAKVKTYAAKLQRSTKANHSK